MTLFKCSSPEGGSYDQTFETLALPNNNNNGVRGSLCYALKTKEPYIAYKYCEQKPLLPSPKDGPVRVLLKNEIVLANINSIIVHKKFLWRPFRFLTIQRINLRLNQERRNIFYSKLIYIIMRNHMAFY